MSVYGALVALGDEDARLVLEVDPGAFWVEPAGGVLKTKGERYYIDTEVQLTTAYA